MEFIGMHASQAPSGRHPLYKGVPVQHGIIDSIVVG